MTNVNKQAIRDRLIEMIDNKSSLIDFDKLNYTTPEHSWEYSHHKFGGDLIEILKDHIKSKTYASQLFLEIMGLSIKDIFQDDMFIPRTFNVIGCPLSTDIDIVIKVDKILDPMFLDMSYIQEELRKLGYIVNDDMSNVDICQIVVDEDGNFVVSSKGSKETQNILYYTYDEHMQKDPPIFSKPVRTELLDRWEKLNALPKFIMDYYKSFALLDTKETHSRKKEIYNDKILRLKFTNEFLEAYIISSRDQLNSELKSITVKLLQTILLDERPELIGYSYCKIPLAEHIAEFFNLDIETILPLLTRGKMGSVNSSADLSAINYSFHIFVKKFIEISENYINLYTGFESEANFSYQENISTPIGEIVHEVYISPIKPTEKMVRLMKSQCEDDQDRTLNKIFSTKTNYPEIQSQLDESLQKWIDVHVELCAPRSERWLELQKYYSFCKNPTLLSSIVEFRGTTFEEWLRTYYNLCRGSVGERLIQDFCDFDSMFGYPLGSLIKFECGYVVKSKSEGAEANAPDLLLIDPSNWKIIPVEMKTLLGEPSYSSNVIREIKLANAQLRSCKEILDDRYIGYSLIVLMFISETEPFKYSVRYSIVKP
jgi:hypothetical protein